MFFGVLGPLTVRTSNGRAVRVPEPKVRGLLAALLVHRGRPVSADRLVADVWGGRPPGNPAAALQNKVWQLRRALEAAEPGGRELVVSRAPGYELLTGGGSVDADRFTELTARARAAAGPGDRAALFAEALTLWRGPAFADFADEEFVRADAVRLAEQRLTVLEEQAETRLELGEHALVADDLGELVALHPLRERLRTAHVRALYLAGRQDAALNSYTELRRRLADELGVDPGPELAALHRAVLAQDPALAAVPAPATTSARPPSNLPRALTGLIGRDGDVTELRTALTRHRLVTLTGPGGVGKTRLALAVAAGLEAVFPGGVRLVELAALAPAADPGDTAPAELVAGVLGVRDDVVTAAGDGSPGPPSAADRIATALGGRPALLVLDNVEHVVEPVAALVAELLPVAPGLTVLATGQSPLRVAGEWLREVAPLAGADAAALFTERARAAAARPVIGPADAEAVAAICRRLDGLPLALEMAATRVRVLGPAELAARLDDRFHVLGPGVRGAPARQRTLRSVLDWSWELLGEPERAVLRRLAVHADGCALAAAEAVCPGDGVARPEVPELLARLVEASLVVVADTPDGPRYRLLESVSAYGLDRLRDHGELTGARIGHRDYYTAFAERAEPHLRGHGQRQWLRLLDAERANLRTALDGAERDGDADRALRLVNALTWYWRLRGRYAEAARRLERALAVAAATGYGSAPADPGPAAAVRAVVRNASPYGAPATDSVVRLPGAALADSVAGHYGRAAADSAPGGSGTGGGPAGSGPVAGGTASVPLGPERRRAIAAAAARLGGMRLALAGTADPEAEYRAALSAYDGVPDPAGLAWARWFLGSHLYGVGDPGPGRELARAALAGFRGLGDTWGTAAALASLAFQAKLRGDFTAVRDLGERSLALFGELGDGWGRLQALVALQTRAEALGEYADAARLHRDGLRTAEELGLWPDVSFQLSGLGRIALLTGDLPRCRELHERARRLAVEQGDVFGEQYAEIGLALGARREGRLGDAEEHLRSVVRLHGEMGYEPEVPPLVLAELGFVAEARGLAGEALRLQSEGLAVARTGGDPRAVALALEGLAAARLLSGDAARAAALLGAAAALRESVGVPLPSGERGDVARVEAGARAELGGPGYEREFARGRTTPPADRGGAMAVPSGLVVAPVETIAEAG
ncbi:BTAD domain-containing putative transcriptional regulator [Streptomyces sp. NPDC020875]|uniref:BTAD domain-containing putative transcriptional regulator n=1 Tax=Streptomyces sp. NPDC020875 TaxID=3154898 RepID=UPI0033D1DC0E